MIIKFLGNFIEFGDIFSFEFDGFVVVGLSAGAIKVFYQLEQLLGVSLSINVFYSFSPFISFVLCYAVSDLRIQLVEKGRLGDHFHVECPSASFSVWLLLAFLDIFVLCALLFY